MNVIWICQLQLLSPRYLCFPLKVGSPKYSKFSTFWYVLDFHTYIIFWEVSSTMCVLQSRPRNAGIHNHFPTVVCLTQFVLFLCLPSLPPLSRISYLKLWLCSYFPVHMAFKSFPISSCISFYSFVFVIRYNHVRLHNWTITWYAHMLFLITQTIVDAWNLLYAFK